MSSILEDVKHILGVPPGVTAFDKDIMIHVNTALATLTQIGVGPLTGFEIKGAEEKWEDFFTEVTLNAVKSYIYLKVRLMFDPPKTGFELASIERQITELEFRLNVVADY